MNGFKKGHKGFYFGGKPPSRKGMKQTEQAKKKMSEAKKKITVPQLFKKGENNINWKGGVTGINQMIRNSPEYRLWRISVFIRDGRKCIWCGSTKDIQADHIKRFADYPELRFAIDNGRTLCLQCHKTTY